METVQAILSALFGGSSGLFAAWLFRGWISERLRHSIRHEYSQKLETHKAELNTRIQEIHHANQLQQLRTSLFFDHQRNAFAGILTKIAETNQAWIDKGSNEDEGLFDSVPHEAYKDLRNTFFKHQLFFDSGCIAAIDLILSYYGESFPIDAGGGQLHWRDVRAAFSGVEFLQPRLAKLFQNRIGISHSRRAEREIALLGSIRILNKHHFKEISLPPKGNLALDNQDTPAEAIVKAEDHCEELLLKLRELAAYLKEDGGWFHEEASRTAGYLEILSSDVGRDETRPSQRIGK